MVYQKPITVSVTIKDSVRIVNIYVDKVNNVLEITIDKKWEDLSEELIDILFEKAKIISSLLEEELQEDWASFLIADEIQ